MLNLEGSHPEYFVKLCALAASGQISEPEFVELQDHMRDCARCQSVYADFIDLLHNKLPLVGSERISGSWPAGFCLKRSSYRERFLARARKQDLVVSHPLGMGLRPIGYAQIATVAMALLLVTVGFLGYGLRRSNARYTALAAQGRQIRELSAKLSDQTETLDRETTLLASSRDIHDLMGARNLHIVDVLDVDSKGKDKRAFGRVFYTEEKSLIFYAFDLGDRGTMRRNASFQVWGARGPAQNPAQSLGIFYVDDQKQNRWVLKFDDPKVLAQIDAVFVTVEPPGGSTRPNGQKLLYAYLNANPNHP